MSILITLIVLLAVFWAVTFLILKGKDLSEFDYAPEPPAWQSFPGHAGPSDGHWQAVEEIQHLNKLTAGLPGSKRLKKIRNEMNRLGLQRPISCTIQPANANGVTAEWVIPGSADSSRRVLYIHGGAFMAGSAISHRNITSRFAEVSGSAVLAIDYRLMPEHRRLEGVEDCRAAYRWILENGPDGPGPVSQVVIGGDSAGGNLALALGNWVRDEKLQQAAAIIAFSPTVDSTFTSPSIRKNFETDVMLGPLFKPLLRAPPWLVGWGFLLHNRIGPANPVVSPVFADLSGLPPILIQVSEVEMLFDDARRYVNKANAAGNRANLQSWGHMLHVWHFFYPEIDEAVQAWQEIKKFLDSTLPPK